MLITPENLNICVDAFKRWGYTVIDSWAYSPKIGCIELEEQLKDAEWQRFRENKVYVFV